MHYSAHRCADEGLAVRTELVRLGVACYRYLRSTTLVGYLVWEMLSFLRNRRKLAEQDWLSYVLLPS